MSSPLPSRPHADDRYATALQPAVPQGELGGNTREKLFENDLREQCVGTARPCGVDRAAHQAQGYEQSLLGREDAGAVQDRLVVGGLVE